MSDFEIIKAVAPKVIAVCVAVVLIERFLDKRGFWDGQAKSKEPKRD
jgi:hypothetical protein